MSFLSLMIVNFLYNQLTKCDFVCRYHYKEGEGGGRDTYLADNNITTYLIEGRVEVILLLLLLGTNQIDVLLAMEFKMLFANRRCPSRIQYQLRKNRR